MFTVGPSLVPYRDAGEMATSLPTLGILHPTSYPLYSLIGYLASHLPLANPAYRLNVFSALAMAGAWGLLWLVICRKQGRLAAWGIFALGVGSYHLWWHALVSEMYALNVLFLAGLLYAYDRRSVLGWSFLFGLGVANRSDLLLVLPAFFYGFWMDPVFQNQKNKQILKVSGLLMGLGLLLYLYLPLRALQAPWLNWDDPSTWERFLRSILRRGYGGGLDLLSGSYATGENFVPEFRLYVIHLWRDYVYVAIPLALGGIFSGWRTQKAWIAMVLVGWMVTGPLFIFLGNLPINPHAVAILEAAYLVPDIFFLLLTASGIFALSKNLTQPVQKIIVALVLSALGLWRASTVYFEVNQRTNFIAVDYNRNVYASVPPASMIIGRSDVPVFSLYYGHWIYPQPQARVPIAQGLLGSEWYRTMMQRNEPELSLRALRSTEDWATLSHQNQQWNVYGTEDIDWPDNGIQRFQPQGIVNKFMELPPLKAEEMKRVARLLLGQFYVYRGSYLYGHYRDFFSNELVEAYAKAWMQIGDEPSLRAAWVIKPDLPYAPFRIGFLQLSQGHYAAAAPYYIATLRNFDLLEEQGREWKSFPSAMQSIHRDHEIAIQHWNIIQKNLVTSH